MKRSPARSRRTDRCQGLGSSSRDFRTVPSSALWDIQRYDSARMKPAPSVPGDTEAERMKNAVRMMFSVSKDAYLKEEARLKRARSRKRAKKPA